MNHETVKAEEKSMNNVESLISSEQYHHFPGTTVTVCALTLVNGFVLTGESACEHPERFNAELGRNYAREHAVTKLIDFGVFLRMQRRHEFLISIDGMKKRLMAFLTQKPSLAEWFEDVGQYKIRGEEPPEKDGETDDPVTVWKLALHSSCNKEQEPDFVS